MSHAHKPLLNMRSRDFVIMAGAFLFFAFMLVVGVRWGIPKARGGLSLTSPAFYPYLVCWMGLAISGIAMAGGAFGPGQECQTRQPSYPPATTLVRLVAVLAVFVLNYVLLERLGALLATISIFAGMLLLGGERRPWIVAATSTGIPIAAYFIFRDLAHVPLPPGILSF